MSLSFPSFFFLFCHQISKSPPPRSLLHYYSYIQEVYPFSRRSILIVDSRATIIVIRLGWEPLFHYGTTLKRSGLGSVHSISSEISSEILWYISSIGCRLPGQMGSNHALCNTVITNVDHSPIPIRVFLPPSTRIPTLHQQNA